MQNMLQYEKELRLITLSKVTGTGLKSDTLICWES